MANGAGMRLGVVGIGARATLARHALAAGHRVVATADPNSNTDARSLELFGAGTALFRSHRDLIPLNLDAVFVTSPDDTHFAIACDMLAARVPVYLEKPIATRVEHADAILQAAYDSNTRLYVGHNMRHMAVVKLMKQLIDDGVIGQVKAIWCRHFVGHGGKFYFKDWHADRRRSTGLLVQKGAHDIDVMHWLAQGVTQQVIGMGALQVYGVPPAPTVEATLACPDAETADEGASSIPPADDWPPHTLRGLNPVVDVEDLSMIAMRLDNGVLCSYQQCHFTPDYWRNYTVIGTHGRLENFGDGDGGLVRVWNKRHTYHPDGDMIFPIEGDAQGHDDADQLTVEEFLRFVATGAPTKTSPVAARYAVAAGIEGTHSLRSQSQPRTVYPLPPWLEAYFAAQSSEWPTASPDLDVAAPGDDDDLIPRSLRTGGQV